MSQVVTSLGLDALRDSRRPEPQTEHRGDARTAVYANVGLHSEHNFWSGITMNMSEGGLFVATHNFVPVGTMLVLNIVLPNASEPLVMLVEVRWTRPYSGQEDIPPGLGLQFVDADDASLSKIRMFVKTIREPLFYED
ncbi:MAG: Signal recognition particle receptor protein FtsY [Myxococcaceae bacterium]|jgi:uncharacterized protein (TIGR02266 family)|nr:Signal recognition particle receptor protein FtsY [Myxococcaceae bacterium]MEA2748522.1 hypothetical protein [Myxococcales bacterium]